MDFEKHREKSMKSLSEAIKRGEVDSKIVRLLQLINSSDGFFTTSSCSGRISLSCVPMHGKKRDHAFIEKWHRRVEYDEVMEKIRNAISSELCSRSILWLKCESFILHVGCKSLNEATELIKLCVELGFKRSGIFRVEPFPFVEIIATDYVAVPLAFGGEMKASENFVKFVLDVMNEKMVENDSKLMRFENEFRKRFSS